jgi:hypothetical protein
MCRYLDPKTFLEELPPPHQLQRPMWAYYELEDGWNVLRRELFGDVRPLLYELDSRGNRPIKDADLRYLARRANLDSGVYHVLICANLGKTALELAQWYRDWEESILTLYCHRAEQDMLAEMGYIA